MKLVHTLICCFFVSLQDGNISIINAQITTYKRTEGRDITVKCFSSSSGKWKIFCKEPCEQENILITTTSNRNQTRRYSIRYEEEGFLTFSTLTVSIKDLSTSDSGQYRCGLSETLSSASIMKFRLIVADALLDGDNNPKGNIVYTRPGRNLTVACSFTFSGSRKLFCKDDCEEEENILVETDGDSATSGRYEIEYTRRLFKRDILYVSITQLDESDSGRYRCALDRTLAPDSYWDFRINVTDAPSTSRPTPISVPSSSTTTTAPSSASTETKDPLPSENHTNMILYVSLTLGFMFVLLLLAVLIFCRNRSKPGAPVETEHISATEINRVYEEIKENKPGRSPPVEISTVYTRVKYTNSKRVGTSDDKVRKAADDSGKLCYSELNFSKRTTGGAVGTASGPRDDVIYSVPRVKARSEAEDDPPLYSTVTSHQK
ncbi:Polymeric immunoglobulin receptor [Channa argus]|nr:Polymeric immunoglobulin receptor [Channa argus]